MELDELLGQIVNLTTAIKQENTNAQYLADTLKAKHDRKITELNNTKKEKESNAKLQKQLLEQEIAQAAKDHKIKLEQKAEDHQLDLEQREKIQKKKKKADKVRLGDLTAQCNEQLERFQAMITEVYHEHEKLLEKMYGNFEVEKRELEDQKKELSFKIEEMLSKHKEERKRIEEKNKEELADKIDKGMLEKASLTLVTNDHKLRNNKKLGEEKNIADLDQKLKDEINQFNTKKAQLKSQINELAERETTIRDKDSKIRDLYKKTQELEKFKFVLDYKIKELKREIGPRETLIQELNEQTTKMRQEEKFFSRMKDNLNLIRKDLSLKSEGLSLEGKKLASILKKQEEEKTEFREAIFNCLKNLGDYKKLKQGIVDLHKVYVSAKEEDDDLEIRKKQAEQRRKNLEDEGRLKIVNDYEKIVEPKRKAGQQIGDADEHRKQSE